MKPTILQFSCKLLTDVIVNQKAATEGPNTTLDFIPGSNFLGIAASQLYYIEGEKNRLSMDESWTMFHSGHVRFGDAHPAIDKNRTLRIPASFYYPKLESMKEACVVHHAITPQISERQNLKTKQLKQCRTGFYSLGAPEVSEAEISTSFAIKSAYDRNKRRSEDEQMFGYQSLSKDLVFLFDVEIDNEAVELKEQVISALQGIKRIGRSRTAQYGQVYIEPIEYKESESTAEKVNCAGVDCVVVYADSRLIFLDENGCPTYQPTPEQLGFKGDSGAEILWDKSQIRTFQYAPWNFKRQCFDTDRCGIEKGSVLIVKTSGSTPTPDSYYVGSYQNEGFGKIIYNPRFLQTDENAQVKLIWKKPESKSEVQESDSESVVSAEDNLLLSHLRSKQTKQEQDRNIYAKVNAWVEKHKAEFSGGRFASQWGVIRSLATQYGNKQELTDKISDYLSHGVAEPKWSKKSRKKNLLQFIEMANEEAAQSIMINLAAEMAKVCK